MTPAGVIAVRKLSQEGILVNFTLGFSARQNYLATAFANPAFVNVFLGRLNAFVHDNGLGDGVNVGEKATLASQCGVTALRERGCTTRQIAASMRGPSQVESLSGVDVFTMPVKVAADYAENPGQNPRTRLNEDYEVSVNSDDVRVFWEIPKTFLKAVNSILDGNPDNMGPEDLVLRLDSLGFPDLFPIWTPGDLAAIATDGKIPTHKRWHNLLSSGDAAVDSLINAAALASFSGDQKAMDERIRGLLHRK